MTRIHEFQGQEFTVEYDAEQETAIISLGELKGFVKATRAGDAHAYQYASPRKGLPTPEELQNIMKGANRAHSIEAAVESICGTLLAERQHLESVARREEERIANRDRLREWAENPPPAEDGAK